MVVNQVDEKIISKKREEQGIVSCDLPDSEQDLHSRQRTIKSTWREGASNY